jgi:hypothetical protein
MTVAALGGVGRRDLVVAAPQALHYDANKTSRSRRPWAGRGSDPVLEQHRDRGPAGGRSSRETEEQRTEKDRQKQQQRQRQRRHRRGASSEKVARCRGRLPRTVCGGWRERPRRQGTRSGVPQHVCVAVARSDGSCGHRAVGASAGVRVARDVLARATARGRWPARARPRSRRQRRGHHARGPPRGWRRRPRGSRGGDARIRFRHARAVSWVTALLTLRDRTCVSDYEARGMPEWQIPVIWTHHHAIHRPDIGATIAGAKVAVEVELSHKAPRRLRAILAGYEHAISHGRLSGGVLYVSDPSLRPRGCRTCRRSHRRARRSPRDSTTGRRGNRRSSPRRTNGVDGRAERSDRIVPPAEAKSPA